MKQFQYVAQNIKGHIFNGQIAALSKKIVAEQLQHQGLFILDLKAIKHRHLSSYSKLNFIKRLHLLLQSELPLYESLQFIYAQAIKRQEKSLFQLILKNVHLGKRFSEVLQELNLFEPVYIALIRSGEQRGNLVDALLIVSDLMENRQKLKRNIFSALSYPLFVAVFAILCFYLLLLFVVPSFENFFEGIELPKFTRLVFALSNVLRNHNLLIVSSFFLSIVSLCLVKPKNWFWKLPLLSSLGLQRDLFLFSKAFYHLHDSDVDILSILELSKDLVINPKLKQRINEMNSEIKSGIKLSESFSKLKLKVSFFIQMVKVGEESANLSGAFKQISIYFESILQYRIKRLLNFLQPIVLLIVAGFIGIIMLSILVPLTDVTRFVDF